jgi:hypothetical protein
MKRIFFIPFLFLQMILANSISAQCNLSKWVMEKGAREAEVIIRLGDIDNINSGFPGGYNPFSGELTEYNDFPWEVDPTDPAGTDRIMVPSSYQYGSEAWNDGYTESTQRPGNNPVPLKLEFNLQGIKPVAAILQIFVNDFQQESSGSRFKAFINGKESADLTRLITETDMTGPKGKLVSYILPSAMIATLSTGKLEILIDDTTSGIGDAYAVDFVRLLINPK